ncbi:hypothetical protein M440DRAFT_1202017 [Trichoderma longibrachiatum ATCC 18648]|uniref:Uncharacterized protein n=1 Tax=Trichoderma longibrachiatum ATCC 18648 TaxID=983965 RepID=A0A2T4CB60_TRILO|nr:hypothetical protein M440DRAFT_1202017 [Trichoderma longibrachiatum ATCC 18648]
MSRYPLASISQRKRLQLQAGALALNRCQARSGPGRGTAGTAAGTLPCLPYRTNGYRRSPPSFPISGYRLLSSPSGLSPIFSVQHPALLLSITTTVRSIDAVDWLESLVSKIKLPSRRPQRFKLANVKHLNRISSLVAAQHHSFLSSPSHLLRFSLISLPQRLNLPLFSFSPSDLILAYPATDNSRHSLPTPLEKNFIWCQANFPWLCRVHCAIFQRSCNKGMGSRFALALGPACAIRVRVRCSVHFPILIPCSFLCLFSLSRSPFPLNILPCICSRC